MQHWAQDPTFPSREVELNDPLAEMARIRVTGVLSQKDSPSLENCIRQILHESLEADPTSWSESTRKIMKGVVEGLRDQEDAEDRIRAASETAVLTVARRWGNIVSAGKATVIATREAAGRSGLNSASAARYASLGAMDGVRRVGPVAYPILQRELEPIVEDFEEMMEGERSRERSLASGEMPIVVVPVEEPEVAVVPEPVLAAVVEEETPVVAETIIVPVMPEEMAPREAPPQPVAKQGFWQKFVATVSGWFGRKK